jgi:ClpP class serine protease
MKTYKREMKTKHIQVTSYHSVDIKVLFSLSQMQMVNQRGIMQTTVTMDIEEYIIQNITRRRNMINKDTLEKQWRKLQIFFVNIHFQGPKFSIKI